MISSRAEAVANFNAIKGQIRQHAGESVKAEGETYTVTDHFQVSSPEGNYTVYKGSSFDSDPKTRDTIQVAMAPKDGVSETRTFENYSAKKLWVFNEERLTVSTQQTQQGNGAVFSSHSKVDFAI